MQMIKSECVNDRLLEAERRMEKKTCKIIHKLGIFNNKIVIMC